MEKLILLFIALFMFCFGSLILTKLIDFGFAVADKLLQNSGRIIKAPFKVIFKLIVTLFKFVFKKSNAAEQDDYTIRPFNITPLELQQMRNNKLRTIQCFS